MNKDEIWKHVYDCLQQEHADTVYMKFVDEYTNRELAEFFGVSQRTIRRWVSESLPILARYIWNLNKKEKAKA